MLALSLAISAPTEDQARQATEMADRIAASMDPAEVESAQLAAELLAAEDRTYE